MKIIGHRGAKGLAPENTLAAIQKALEHKADAVEIDVRITKDAIPVLLHDAEASDAAGNRLRARQHTYKDLKTHKPDLPTLADAIAFIDRRVPIIIELKPHEPTEPVKAVVQDFLARGWKAESIQFISFDFRILQDFKHTFPEHILIVDELWSGVRATWRARRLGTKHISIYAPTLWIGFIKAANRRGYLLYCFPANNVKQARKWAKHGLYAVITDCPDEFESH